jgi:hypothetical protein
VERHASDIRLPLDLHFLRPAYRTCRGQREDSNAEEARGQPAQKLNFIANCTSRGACSVRDSSKRTFFASAIEVRDSGAIRSGALPYRSDPTLGELNSAVLKSGSPLRGFRFRSSGRGV